MQNWDDLSWGEQAELWTEQNYQPGLAGTEQFHRGLGSANLEDDPGYPDPVIYDTPGISMDVHPPDDAGGGFIDAIGGFIGGVVNVLEEIDDRLDPDVLDRFFERHPIGDPWDAIGGLLGPIIGGQGEYPDQEPLGGYASEIAGVAVGAGVTAVAGPFAGAAAGVLTEAALEKYWSSPAQPDFGGYSDMTMQIPQLQFLYVKTNRMTGLKFGRLVDGRMVYQRKNGTVSIHRPKKPIVLYPGKVTLSQASRAATQLGNIAKRLKKSKFKAFL